MKKQSTVKILIVFVLLIAQAILLISCGYSFDYNKKILKADEYFVKIQFLKEGLPSVYLNCSYKNNSYAYRYSLQENVYLADLVYRQIFINDKMYEIEEVSALDLISAGQYKVTDNINAESKTNFMYTYLKYITQGTYLTLLKSPQRITEDGIECDKFDVNYDGYNLTYYFNVNDKLIYKLKVDNGKEKIELIYKEYKFEDVGEKDFRIPGDFLYKKVDKLVYQIVIDML